MSLRQAFLVASLALAFVSSTLGGPPLVDPQSPSGLDYYAQGGVVVDGIAYFTSDDHSRRRGVSKTERFPHVVAFRMDDYRKIRTYAFAETYDSSPLVIQKKDGVWLVLAHEHLKARTVAINRDSGQVEWTSEANQPGMYFFGYSYYACPDGTKLILQSCPNGLHAMSSETGKDVWWVPQRSSGGVTPCVDQRRGWIFYQATGKILKIRAADGEVLAAVNVSSPNTCISWNTALVDDEHGYFVATRWYGRPEWDSAIRVYDQDLKLVWERAGLPSGKKDTLTYAEGKLVTGAGNGWSKNYTGDAWKYIAAYRIGSGEVAWKCDLSEYHFTCIPNVPYFQGFFYAETAGSPPPTSKLFRIDAGTGKLEEVLDYGRAVTSCAPCLIARGKLMDGDLWQDRTVVTLLAEGSQSDWPGPFGDPQTNQNAVAAAGGVKLVPMREVRESGP